MNKTIASFGLAALFLGASSFESWGIATLRFSDVNGTFDVVDGSAGDLDSVVNGFVIYAGLNGTFAAGTSASPTPSLSLSAMTTPLPSSPQPFPLTISFSDDGFTGSGLAFATLGGAFGSVTYNTYVDPGNALFGTTIPLTSIGAFPGTDSALTGALGSPYSVTLEFILTADSSVDGLFDITGVPDAGLSIALLSGALMCLVGFSRWSRFRPSTANR